jgi:hypothetical protein
MAETGKNHDGEQHRAEKAKNNANEPFEQPNTSMNCQCPRR